MLLALLLVPVAAGVAAFWLRPHFLRRALLLAVALFHAGVTFSFWADRPAPLLDGWLAVDAAGLLFLSIASALFLAVAVYGVSYLHREDPGQHRHFTEGILFVNEPEAVFTGCLLLFLASITLVTVSHHFGLLWVAVEATTLASAPLIYFHRHPRSLEATWKYLLICSVGIALALLGNFLLAAAASGPDRETVPLLLGPLSANAPRLNLTWLRPAFLLLLVGYGTKMGLAPLHTWLPDAHSEAPSMISALLSGALLNCAFLAILRAHQVCVHAGPEMAEFSRQLLVGFGLLSMAVAAAFIFNQTDFKRMLAYSSVDHMGILALGVGLGGLGSFGAMFHAVNNSLTKAGLFLVAGNLLTVYQTKEIRRVTEVDRRLPWSAALWLAGFLAVTGTPPFGVFISEFTILRAALYREQPLVAALYLGILAVIFIGMASLVLGMVQSGPPEGSEPAPRREVVWTVLPPTLLIGAVLVLGVYVPPALTELLREAARPLEAATSTMGGQP
jgi:hydrogenase-4 component F